LLAIGLLDLGPEDLDAPATEPAARRRGDFAAADAIRERVDQIGVELRDTPDGTVWNARAEPANRRRGTDG